jgi:hypothetical protein
MPCHNGCPCLPRRAVSPRTSRRRRRWLPNQPCHRHTRHWHCKRNRLALARGSQCSTSARQSPTHHRHRVRCQAVPALPFTDAKRSLPPVTCHLARSCPAALRCSPASHSARFRTSDPFCCVPACGALPVPSGISSKILGKKTHDSDKVLCSKKTLIGYLISC